MNILEDDLDHPRIRRKEPRITRRDYYWTWAPNPVKGGLIIFGWYKDEMEAREDVGSKYAKFGVSNYEVTPLKTRDRSYAKAQLYKLWSDKSNTTLEDIMHRAAWSVPNTQVNTQGG